MSKYINHKYLKKDIIEHRLYQELLTAKAIEEDTLVVAPTGLGKTIIAILLMSYTYNPNKNILFLAPTKPLVIQHKKSSDNLLNIDSDKLILLTGSTTAKQRSEIYNNKGLVICATPQTIRNDINNNLINKDDFNLVIFDEAHRATGDYAYCEISSFFKNIKRLGLTASPGSNKSKIEDVASNLNIHHIEIRTEEDNDVKNYIKDIDIDIRKVELDFISRKISSLLDELIYTKIVLLRKCHVPIQDKYSKKQIIAMQRQTFMRISEDNTNTRNFIVLSALSSMLKLLHAKELIETQGIYSFNKYIQQLVSDGNKNKRSTSIKGILNSDEFRLIFKIIIENKDKIVYSKEVELIDIVKNFIKQKPDSKILVFNNFRDNASHLTKILNENKDVNAIRFVGQATKKDDVGLSQKKQIKLIEDFKKHKFNTLVCTSVAEEGLDIPKVDLVVFYDAVASEIRSIQRRGRTGRFDIGKVILLLNKDTIDEKYYLVSKSKEKKMKSILSDFNNKKIFLDTTKKFQKKLF